MKIKVLRDYSGAEGEGPMRMVFAGSEHEVTRERASLLEAHGLVVPFEERQAKSQQPPENKAAVSPPNKATPSARTKAGATKVAKSG